MFDNINAEKVTVGRNVVIEDSAIIRGINGKSKSIFIGDNTYIGKNVQIICDDFSIGDYSKIHHNTNIHGYKPCHIGHNAWIGQYCIIDSIGGTTIGDNCGIGAHSQLWSHIKYGDTLEGSRFLSESPLVIGNDVWFVGHCIVSPVNVKDKALALVGSVITKDMDYNCIYAGSPAKDISSKTGFHFNERGLEEKFEMLKNHLNESKLDSGKIRIVKDTLKVCFEDDMTYFDVSSRKYTKKYNKTEIQFMKYLLPEKGKFTPF